jgi:mono/diheme cytochrome c family protein
MKSKWLIITLSALLIVILIAACAQEPETAVETDAEVIDTEDVEAEDVEDAEAEDVEAEDIDIEDDEAEVIDAEALIKERCSTCHSSNLVFNADYDEQGWVRTIDRMVAKGAKLSDEEKALMIEWLLARP